ncbi:MAG: site-specific DNA-methyltransferase [Citromicrobium sp.]|nr:site-specific DNA-methyltransferase [Citromicrobium sp.]
MATKIEHADLSPRPSSRRRASSSWRTTLATHIDEQWDELREAGAGRREHLSSNATYVLEDAVQFLSELPSNSIHAVVTDPPYGVIEYDKKNHQKLRNGRGGVWRQPPSFDGSKRSPLPRFTVLSEDELTRLHSFFSAVAYGIHRALVPGGHAFVAANPLLSTMTFHAFQGSGLEKRGEVIRLVTTLRGGDRPKGAEKEFRDVSMMARSGWEPWGIFRKPMIGTAAENLRAYGTGGLRRVSDDEPFRDVITCSPTRGREREMAPHPSLKPQRFMRQLVRASLPLGIGIVLDPFAGSGSTLAAAEAVGYRAIGTDRDYEYYRLAQSAFPTLAQLECDQ